jgi:hypothetical protein
LGHPLSDRRVLVQTSFRQPFYYPPQQAKLFRPADVGVPSQLSECLTSILERLNPIGLAADSAFQAPQEAPARVFVLASGFFHGRFPPFPALWRRVLMSATP